MESRCRKFKLEELIFCVNSLKLIKLEIVTGPDDEESSIGTQNIVYSMNLSVMLLLVESYMLKFVF